MEPQFDEQGHLVEPIKPEDTLEELEEKDPGMAKITREVLGLIGGQMQAISQGDELTPGLEGMLETVHDGYDLGWCHIFWTPDRRMATAMLWNGNKYVAWPPYAKGKPLVFVRTATWGWKFLHPDTTEE